jgi:hypothetical protein
MDGGGFGAINLEALRTLIQKMTDQELLRFGKAAKYMTSAEANMVIRWWRTSPFNLTRRRQNGKGDIRLWR